MCFFVEITMLTIWDPKSHVTGTGNSILWDFFDILSKIGIFHICALMFKHRDPTRIKLYYISEVLKKSIWAENPRKNFILDHQLTPIGFFWDKLSSSDFISAETLWNAVKLFKIYFWKIIFAVLCRYFAISDIQIG